MQLAGVAHRSLHDRRFSSCAVCASCGQIFRLEISGETLRKHFVAQHTTMMGPRERTLGAGRARLVNPKQREGCPGSQPVASASQLAKHVSTGADAFRKKRGNRRGIDVRPPPIRHPGDKNRHFSGSAETASNRCLQMRLAVRE